ncbi:MAG: M16 family metallopeptidase [Trueperaceae bacterium]
MKRSWVVLLVLSCCVLTQAQDLADRVTKVTLDNGMRVLFVEQGVAPTIAFNFMFDVGGADEPNGLGGIAHMVEHMAFKGTSTIGATDYEAEKKALEQIEIERLALEYLRENGSEEEIASQEERFAAARAAAQDLADPAALDDLLGVNGGVAINASTGYDRTDYVVQLPSNRLELYARIYGDVLRNPVFRQFYEERDVVREERRQRSEDDPQGFLLEAFTDEAFDVHPYGRSLIGSNDEITGYSKSAALAFFERYYHPNRAVLVLVGDVDVERDLPIIEKYFGDIPSAPDLRPRIPVEPEKTEERRVTVEYNAEPQLVIGYHKPTYPNPDAYVFDLVDSLLSNGRTSRLYQRLILRDQSAVGVFTTSAYPGTRFNNLFLVYALPQQPATPETLEATIYEEIERLKTELVSTEELAKVKNQVRAGTVRSLESPSGLASSLAYHELFAGGWEKLISDLDIYDAVTPEDIQRVATDYLVPENRTVGTLLTKGATE